MLSGGGSYRTERKAVVVCGGGAAGMAAALGAARAGAEVVLVEAASEVGGTVASVLIHTLGGIFDEAGAFINDGLAKQLAEELLAEPAVCRRRIGRTWVLSVPPETYQATARRWLDAEANITVLCDSRVEGVRTAGDRVVEVTGTRRREPFRLAAKAVVDATGTAEVIRLLDPALVQDDPRRAAGGLFVRLRNVAPSALTFPKGLPILRALRNAAAEGRLPVEAGHTWLDVGCYDDEIYVKLFVPFPAADADSQALLEIERKAAELQSAVILFLRGFPQFAQATTSQVGSIGVRDGGRVRGEYCLTAADVRAGRRFPDAASRCCWPIEYWDPERGVSLEYLPAGGYYEIPIRAWRARGWGNVYMAGKCFSAEPLAQASARVVGSCWAMGEAVGKAAAAD